MPTIGITNCRKLEDYRQSVLHVGGDVRLLETAADLAGMLDGLDGLLLTGGGDVDPALYGEAPHATLDPAEPGRDQFELALVTLARQQSLPLLAICRGIQVLNVACGGTLVQDIGEGQAFAIAQLVEDVVGADDGVLQIRAGFAFEAERFFDVEHDQLAA